METHIVPKASPATLPELATYLAPCAPLFRRSTSRASVERYLTGLLTDLPRKNCDTIAAAVAETSTERLQHLLTDATWEPRALDQQRVRTLVAQSPPQGLLVLDEATSAVDPALDVQLREAIERLTRGRTSVTIAHRLSTAEAADRVLVFDEGHLVEDGSHRQLLAAGGVYAALYRDWSAGTRAV